MKPKLRILNLEDDLNDAALNQAMLSARWPECELIRVASRKEFVEALEVGGFDLILSDYTIPGFDGRSALQLARERRPETPFIFVSGTIGEDTAIEALKNGAIDYVLKHRPMRLIPAVDRALREVKERNECARAEEAMRQSEYKYRELFENLGDGAFLVDEKTGKIIDTNRKTEAMIGCHRSEILGHKEKEFLALDEAHPIVDSKDASPAVVFECRILPQARTPFRVEVRTTRLTLFDHPLVLRICHDLSERQTT